MTETSNHVEGRMFESFDTQSPSQKRGINATEGKAARAFGKVLGLFGRSRNVYIPEGDHTIRVNRASAKKFISRHVDLFGPLQADKITDSQIVDCLKQLRQSESAHAHYQAIQGNPAKDQRLYTRLGVAEQMAVLTTKGKSLQEISMAYQEFEKKIRGLYDLIPPQKQTLIKLDDLLRGDPNALTALENALYDEFDPEAENPRGLDVLRLLCNDDPTALERERNRLADQTLPNKKAIVLGWARQFSECVTERYVAFWEKNKKDLNIMQGSLVRDNLLQGTNPRCFDAFKIFFKDESLRREKELQKLQGKACAELEISSPTGDLAAFQKEVQELHSILPKTSQETILLEKLKNGDVDALKALNEELRHEFPFERGKPTERISIISAFFGWKHPSSREETHSYALYYQMEVDRNLDTFMESLKDQKPPELSDEAFKKRTRETLLQCTDRDLVSSFKEKVQEKRRETNILDFLNIPIPATQDTSAKAVDKYQTLVQTQWNNFQKEVERQENPRNLFLSDLQQKLMQCSDGLLISEFKEFCQNKGLL